MACDRFTNQNTSTPTLEDILEADRWARQEVIKGSQEIAKGNKIMSLT